MDIIKTSREIGLFEAALNMSMASDSQEVSGKIEEAMPMPGADFAPRIAQAADYLLSFGKRKLMLLSPEIALIEEIGKKAGSHVQVILVMPCDMDPESKERLRNNIPKDVFVQFLEEPYFAENFTPADGLIAAFGYMAGNHLMMLPEAYRMTDRYCLWGKRVFVPYVVRNDATRFPNWIEMNPRKFSHVWEENNNETE